jgi:hypothetical protein
MPVASEAKTVGTIDLRVTIKLPINSIAAEILSEIDRRLWPEAIRNFIRSSKKHSAVLDAAKMKEYYTTQKQVRVCINSLPKLHASLHALPPSARGLYLYLLLESAFIGSTISPASSFTTPSAYALEKLEVVPFEPSDDLSDDLEVFDYLDSLNGK